MKQRPQKMSMISSGKRLCLTTGLRVSGVCCAQDFIKPSYQSWLTATEPRNLWTLEKNSHFCPRNFVAASHKKVLRLTHGFNVNWHARPLLFDHLKHRAPNSMTLKLVVYDQFTEHGAESCVAESRQVSDEQS